MAGGSSADRRRRNDHRPGGLDEKSSLLALMFPARLTSLNRLSMLERSSAGSKREIEVDMNNLVTLTLTEDQAKELPYIIYMYRLYDAEKARSMYGKPDETDEKHYAFVLRIRNSIKRQLVKAKTS